LDDLAEEGDEGPTDTRCSAKKNISGSEVDASDVESDIEFIASGINHGDLFSKNKGGAQIAQGDDDFDEEMGGESQVLEVATKIACEGIWNDIEDDSDEGKDKNEDEGGDNDDDVTEKNESPPRSKAADEDEAVGSNVAPLDTHVEGFSNCPVWESTSHVDSPEGSPEPSKLESSENRSHDCSPFSLDGLRTQPTQTPTSTQPKPITKRVKIHKVTLMGTAFETSNIRGPQPDTKKATDLYIPSYSRRKN
jgi:hypothetical protein